VAWALIIGVNFANDYSDGIRGTDDDRTGPQRLTGGGLAKPQHVKYAAFGCFAVAGIAGIWLSLAAGAWWFILIGALCIAGAWFYTGGNNPYGYPGWVKSLYSSSSASSRYWAPNLPRLAESPLPACCWRWVLVA